jgi:hypothetical protein
MDEVLGSPLENGKGILALAEITSGNKIMKKVLLSTILSCLAFTSLRADLIWNEPFNYADGPIISNSSGLWVRHSGSASPSDSVVKNGRLEVASSSPGAVPRTDDVHRDFTSNTNTQTILYSSFTVNCTNLPPAVGTYFAHFYVNSSTFHGRVFAQAGTLPNTWRLGIAGAAGTVSAVFPVDLAPNTDYQVVLRWDPVSSFSAQLWVNPLAETDTFAKSTDSVSAPAASLGYAFRQGGSFGNAFFDIDNLVVATLFDEALTNLLATNAVAPAIVYQPKGGTNFVGSPWTFTTVANGQGLANLTYTWLKNGAPISNPAGNANVLTLPTTDVPDTGNYQVAVATPYGLSATSAVASVWVTNPPVPPTITQQPTNEATYYGQTATLYCGATGPGTLSYMWYHNNNTVASEGNPYVSGDGTPTLAVANVQTNNGTTGTYRCDVSNIYGTTPSSNAVVSAISVPVVAIDYLRGLVDPTFYLPTNTTALWSASGIVTVYTNLTASPNLSIMIQDATAGIGVFMSGAAANLPQAGDSVTVVGSLGNFNSMLQINVNPADPSNLLTVNSHNNPLPTPYVLPLSFTNGIAYGGVSNVIRKYVSALVTFPNVYITDPSATFPSGQLTETITNTSGDSFRVFFNAAVTPVVAGQPIPRGAVSVTGPMSYFLSTTATDRSAGFEIDPTRYDDIAATPPLPVTISTITATAIAYTGGSGAQFVLLQSSDVDQPLGSWTRAATNSATPGSFTISASTTRRFYRITSE